MPDVVDQATRSRMMRGIKGKDTQPELRVRRRMHAAGLRYRVHRRDLPGTPDIVFPGIRTVVFVNGCFWHQHPGCKLAAVPGTNAKFWADKLGANTLRDGRTYQQLADFGWETIVVWECARDAELDTVVLEIKRRLSTR